MRNEKKVLIALSAAIMILSASAFAAPKHWVVGFSQFGSESDWRTASTVSIQSAFLDDPSFTLIYSEAQQKQENQIKAIRSFIARKVNAILITPLVETDYGPVLQEAKKAGIPVVMIDRDVAKDDRALRIAFMGSSFVKEGEKAANWLADYLKKMNMDDGNKSVNIVELTGTPGAAPSIERGKGFRKISDLHSNWKITQSQPGNFTSDEGAAVTTAFLKEDKDIQVLFAHNDLMALGAVQAIKEAGLQPGKDIIVIGMDGIEEAFEAMVAGDMNCTVECNPLVGPQAVRALADLRAGKKLPSRIWTLDGVFDQTDAAAALPTRLY
jgi:simple sugar transport system substrate-binding protein